jgi:alkyl hydroperoxide reductase subunit D
LTANQIFGVALSTAYATKNRDVIDALLNEAKERLSEAEITATKSAATIMGMNNIYYRFLHLSGDADFKQLPAKLRMNVIGNPGIPKTDFELYCLAVSAVNGCGMCIEAHTHEVVKGGISKLGVQSTVRIASVVHAAAAALSTL